MTGHINGIDLSDELTIEVIRQLRPGPGSWVPRAMRESCSLVFNPSIPRESSPVILQEAVNVLSRCVPPTEPVGQYTGLVIGYVQSGKTMSFTTVAALAHDNGYRIIIIVAGTSQYLLDQSRRRLINDLRLNSSTERRPWRHIQDPTLAQNSHIVIRNILEDWNDPSVPPEDRRTVLITVMKHHQHLQNLIDVLNRINLDGVPTLIIDDEGDQAGLNARVRQGQQSTTYQRLLLLKATTPHHSFLQYTATPQAPLLINIVDVLSPSFAEVITPGDGYVGGHDIFDDRSNLIRLIPSNEIPQQNNRITSPPQTLHQAMRLFFLGATIHLVRRDMPPNRSMMVHPSRLTERHGQYYRWVFDTLEGWMDILRHSSDTPDHIDLIQLFRHDYDDLRSTVPGIPSFEYLTPHLLRAMRQTDIRIMNNRPEGRTPVNWSNNPYWILVGGQSMDRGFTVEGLTVTYMPRGPGVANADTIQQRARFFGYKREYFGFCRIFLERDVREAFRAYVEHEEDIRSQLIAYRDTGRTLTEWRREFFLDRNLRPTRNNVIDINYWRESLGDRWIFPEGPHDTEKAMVANRSVFEQFIARLHFIEHDGLDRRTTEHKNLIARDVSLRQVHECLLTRVLVRRLEDSRRFSLLLRQIQIHLTQHPDDTCTVFFMAGGNRIRRDCENNEIKQLFQGRQVAAGVPTYPGDRQVRADEGISIQLRYLDLGPRDNLIAQNVPHVAVWMPASIARDIVRQPQGG